MWSGACAPVSRIRSAGAGAAPPRPERAIIYLGRLSPAASSGLPVPMLGGLPLADLWKPGGPGAGRARYDLALHPVGFAGPPLSPGTPVRSYRTLSPLTAAEAAAGLLSVARAVGAAQRDAAFPLGSTVPCGVRTFLTAGADAAPVPTERCPGTHTTVLTPRGWPGSARRKGTNEKKRSGLWAVCALTGPAYPSCRRPSRCRGPDRR